ncbi:hypothetical protein ISS03_05400 [Patescibacteria group bacterium]|nr:hypothetical protein [Patescibacteria group bacterium]
MLNLQNSKLRGDLKKFVKLFDENTHDFGYYLIIYDFLEYLDKVSELEKIIRKLKKETKALKKSVSINGLFLLLEKSEYDISILDDIGSSYLLLDITRDTLNNFKNKKSKTKIEIRLNKTMSSKRAKEVFDLALNAICNHCFDLLDKESFLGLTNKANDDDLWFSEEKSLFCVQGYKIAVSRHDKITNIHKIMKYIFITNTDNLDDDFFYSEIAMDEFEDLEYTKDKMSWKKYYDACFRFQAKVAKSTGNKINNLLIFNSGQQGRVKINPKYLPHK